MKIGNLEIGPGQPCRIVAELSNSHNGDRDRLGRMIDAAQVAGADLVKFQCYTPDELVALRGDGPAPEPWGSQGHTMRTLYEKAQTPLDWFPKIAAHCERVGIPWFSSVFGAESLACLEAVGCPAYKISHFERGAVVLLSLVRATGKPIIVSSPERWGATGPEPLLYCPGGYPALPTDMHLDHLNGTWLGLSAHCVDPLIGALAVARDAKMVEVHFHLHDEPSELEAAVSYDEHQLYDLVQQVRRAEAYLG